MDARGCLEELDISGNEYDGSVHDGPQQVHNRSQSCSVHDGTVNDIYV